MSWFRVVPDKSGAVTIGRYKEQLVREVAFPLPPLGEGGHYLAKLQRPHDEAPYPLASRVEGRTLIWLVSLEDTSDPGEGLVEIRWDGPNGETWKSPQYAVRIAKGLADPKEAPEAWAGFLQQVNRDAGRAESAADNAAKALKKLEEGIASGDFRGEKGEQGEKGDPGPQGPRGEAGPAGDTTAADAAAEAAKKAAQEAQKAAQASAGSAAQAAESVGGLADDLEATQKDLAKMKRAIKFQSELNKGQTWDFEVDTQTAYQRIVPSGAKAGAVMEVGGKTVVWNQLCDALPNPGTYKGVKVSVSNGKVSLSGTATDAVLVGVGYAAVTVSGHKYMATGLQGGSKSTFYVQGVNENNGYYNILDSTAIFAATGAKYRYNIIAVAGTVFSHTFQPMVVDLTLMFGPGNEPADTSDPRIAQIEAYAAAHPEYNSGELVSAEANEVIEAGKNLIDYKKARVRGRSSIIEGGVRIVNYSGDNSGGRIVVFPVNVKKGRYYSIRAKVTVVEGTGRLSAYFPDLNQYLSFKQGNLAEGDFRRIGLYVEAKYICTVDVTDIQLEESSTPTAYSPYHQETYPIPSAVRNLPGYGWSAGSVANTVERTENGWQYVQRVGSVDLGELTWVAQKSVLYDLQYFASQSITHPTKAPAFLTAAYATASSSNVVATDKSCWVSFNWGEDGRVIIRDDKYADAASFKSAMRGMLLYYELSDYITTDITALMGDSLAPFSVEAGGSITMHHPKADEGFAIDVPAKIQYITKLSEVSANG